MTAVQIGTQGLYWEWRRGLWWKPGARILKVNCERFGKVAYPIDGRSCYLTNSPLSAPFLKFNLICKPSIQVIFKTVVWGHKHSHASPSRLFINMRYVNKVFYNPCPCRYYLLAEKEFVGLKVQEIRVICAVCPGKMTKFHPSCACWLKALFHIHVYSN